LKSPAATSESRDGSMVLRSVAFTSSAVSEAMRASNAMSQVKVRPAKE